MAGPMQWADLLLLLEPSCLALMGTASAIVGIGAVRALEYELSLARMGLQSDEAAITLDGQQAMLLPVFASIALLSVFYFFSSIQFLMLMAVCITAAGGIAFALHPLLWTALARARGGGAWARTQVSLCGFSSAPADQVALGLLGVVLVLWWLVTGSWLLNNILGTALAICFISFVRLPNIKVCTLLLSGLFVYDIFFVFISPYVWGSNVMVEAATKQADNPVHLAAEALHLPIPSIISRHLDMPVKLLFPRSFLNPVPEETLMLGLGDMALPGLLLAMLLCNDFRRAAKRMDLPGSSGGEGGGLSLLLSWQFWWGGYCGVCWLGYCTGLLLALGCGVLFRSAQPALLYLVPCTLLPVMARAMARGEWGELWGGQRLMVVASPKVEEPEQRV